MNFLETNLRVLEKRFPVVARRVRQGTENGNASVDAASTSLGSIDDKALLERWGAGITLSENSLLALSGIGNGRPLRHLLARCPRGTFIFAAEADASHWLGALAANDLSDVLSDPRVMVGAGEPDDAFFTAMDEVDILRFRGVAPVLFTPWYQLAEAYFARFFTAFARQFDMRRKLWGTRLLDSAFWQGNTMTNLRRLTAAPDVAVGRDIFRGLPMIVVSAGPSLDESIEFLRAVRERAVIVAVNSACRALVRAGVPPHLTVAADPRQFTAMGYDGVSVEDIFLVAPFMVYPGVVERFLGRTFTWVGSNELVAVIRRRCGLPAGTSVIEQGTVSACCVDLALLFGCRKICLVGQDLAVRGDGQSHASDSFYADMGANRQDLASCRWLPGNTLKEVPVEERFYVYLKTFEQLVAARPGIEFINTAPYGARIQGVPYMDFEKARSWLGQGDAREVTAKCAAALRAGLDACLTEDRLEVALAPTAAFAEAIVRTCLPVLLDPKATPADWQRARADVEARFAEAPEDYRILEAGRTRLELFRARETVERAGGEAAGPLENREFLWAWAEGAFFLKNGISQIFKKNIKI